MSSTSYQRVRISKPKDGKPLVRRYAMKRQRGAIVTIPRMMGSSSSSASRKELKGVDVDLSIAPIIATTNTNGSAFLMNAIQSGTGSWNRIGKKTWLKSFRIKGNFTFLIVPTFATGASTTNYVRMVVVWDRQPNEGAIPAFDTVFGITDGAGVESCPDITCPPRYDGMDRFRIIHDSNHVAHDYFIPSFGGAPSSGLYCPVDVYQKLPNLESLYANTANPLTTANISSGALLVYFRAYQNNAVTNGQFDGISRVRYVD